MEFFNRSIWNKCNYNFSSQMDIIDLIGNMGIEKYRNELEKETMKYQYSLDHNLEKFKIQYSRLHLEQAETIKELYKKLIIAVGSLEYLLRPIKINPSKTEEEAAQEVIELGNDFFEFSSHNEIIFNEKTSELIENIKSKYLKVWNTYSKKTFMGENISSEMSIKIIDDMKIAYETILEKEMLELKKELKKEFRIQLGIIEEKL